MTETSPVPAGRMEFQRQNLWVGLFVLAALAAFMAVAVFALKERIFRREYTLHTSFQRIEGLKPGADVFLRGYAVGRVTKIGLHTTPEVRFDVDFTVEEAIRLPAGTRARLSTRGFVNKVLEIVTPGDSADPGSPPAPPTDRKPLFLTEGAAVPGAAGADVDALFNDVLALTRRLSTTIDRFDRVVVEGIAPDVKNLVASANQNMAAAAADLRSTMKELRDVLGEAEGALEENRPKVSRALDRAEEDLKAAGDLAGRLDRSLTELEGRIYPLANDLAAALDKADALLTRMDASIKEEDLKVIMANLKTLSEKGLELVEEVRKHPWRLLRRVPGEKEAVQEDLEAQP